MGQTLTLDDLANVGSSPAPTQQSTLQPKTLSLSDLADYGNDRNVIITPTAKKGFWDTYLDEVNPLHSVPGLAKALVTLPDSPFFTTKGGADISGDQAYQMAKDANEGKGPSREEILGHAAALGTNAALGAAATAGLVKGSIAARNAWADAVTASPAKDAINLYGITDPRAPERLPTGVSDIDHDSGADITSNEHIATTSPDYKAAPAFAQNRAVWQQWMDQTRGRSIPPDSILQAAKDSLKGFADPVVKASILDDLESKLRQQPLSGPRLEEINSEINNELKSGGFYSRDEAARAAARAAGAQSGRSQAFLEAVGNKARDELYSMADPDNAGAGPREVQRRYGNMKMVTDPATEDRSKIYGETAGTGLEKLQNLATSLLNLPGKAVTGQLSNPIDGIRAIFKGESDPIVQRIFDNAPAYKPLPTPPAKTPPAGLLGPGPLITPAPEDPSRVVGVPAVGVTPTTKLLPQATTRFQGGIPDQSYVRGEPSDVLGSVMRGVPPQGLLESNPGAGNLTINPATREFQVPPARYSNLKNQGTREVSAQTGTPVQTLKASSDLSAAQITAIHDAIKAHGTLTKSDMVRIGAMK